MGSNNNLKAIIRKILRDISVELGDEFDKNFERQAYFSRSWARRRSPLRPGGATLIDSGTLRKSISIRSDESSVTFSTDKEYAAIHNQGGEITVTAKMKRFFWAKYYAAAGSFGRKKDGSLRRDKRTLQLTSEADFWRALALMKVGKKIRIPQRQFLGGGAEVEKLVREIVEENMGNLKIDFNIK